jgi:hypothetical protein
MRQNGNSVTKTKLSQMAKLLPPHLLGNLREWISVRIGGLISVSIAASLLSTGRNREKSQCDRTQKMQPLVISACRAAGMIATVASPANTERAQPHI